MLANVLRQCTRAGPLSNGLLSTKTSLYSLQTASRAYAAAAQPIGTKPLIGRYDHVPVSLARVQSGVNISLRDYETQRALKRFSYDLKLIDERVLPAPGPNFIGPNGCSLREPLSPTFQEVVRNFRGRNIIIYVLEAGIKLPSTLTILHEHSDHYSMQCTEPMTLDDLNAEITEFVVKHARTLDKEQFDEEFPFSI